MLEAGEELNTIRQKIWDLNRERCYIVSIRQFTTRVLLHLTPLITRWQTKY